MFIFCLLAVEFDFAEGAGILMISTDVVIICHITMHFNISHFAYMSLNYTGSIHCVFVHYMLDQCLPTLELLSTGVALFFGGPMSCVNMIH